MKLYYTELFAQYPDVLTATEISKVIGYGTTSINNWCNNGHLKAFKRNNMNHIPKIYLIEFCCSKYFALSPENPIGISGCFKNSLVGK